MEKMDTRELDQVCTGLGDLGEEDLSSDSRGISYDGSTGSLSERSKGRRRNEAGAWGQGHKVKDFESPGVCTCPESPRLLPEGFQQRSEMSKSFCLFGRRPEPRGAPMRGWEKLMLML